MIIKQAAAATDQVQDLVGKAIEILTAGFHGRIVNGYGVYSDPAARRGDLRAARTAIDEALQILANSRWPTPAEYDAPAPAPAPEEG